MTKPIKLTKAQGLFLLDCMDESGAFCAPMYQPMRTLLHLGFIKSTGVCRNYRITPTGKSHLEGLKP